MVSFDKRDISHSVGKPKYIYTYIIGYLNE